MKVNKVMKHVFCANPKLVFSDHESYRKFKKNVDKAVRMLGFKSHTEFLRAIYFVLYKMAEGNELTKISFKIFNELIDRARKEFTLELNIKE